MDSTLSAQPSSQSSGSSSPKELPEMFRPPVNRAMRVLDRSFFRKTVPLSAATVFEQRNIARVRKELESAKDILDPPMAGINKIRQAPAGTVITGKGGERKETIPEQSPLKCLLLREDIKHNDKSTWTPKINQLVEEGTVGLGGYNLELNYDNWPYHDIITSILPEEALKGETPMGFTINGHILHLNLREAYYPYKYLIGEILKDKNPGVRTVINKTEDVGSHSEFRTFPFEILAGDDDMVVTVHEQDCEFRFDFSKVYWNSRLETEHRRLVRKFQPGELVCDVMAGVGPFAVPAGRKRIFVWANDLNPECYTAMNWAIDRNHVKDFVTAFNMDGREFIRQSAGTLLDEHPKTVTIKPKKRKTVKGTASPSPPPQPEVYVRPPTVDHYVMNLPATAIDFLDAFIGAFSGKEELFEPYTDRKLPFIHVYCFAGKSEDERDDHVEICKRISERMGFTLTPDDTVDGTGNRERELEIHNVRLVSPSKQMFCASFRLPREVAFKSVLQVYT